MATTKTSPNAKYAPIALIIAACAISAAIYLKSRQTAPPPAPGPHVAVTVYDYPNPKNPLAADFVARNNGAFPVKNITCHFVLKKFKIADGIAPVPDMDGGKFKIDDIPTGAEAVIHGTNAHFMTKELPMIYAELEIGIAFTDAGTQGREFDQAFDFFTQRQPDQTMRWYPAAK